VRKNTDDFCPKDSESQVDALSATEAHLNGVYFLIPTDHAGATRLIRVG